MPENYPTADFLTAVYLMYCVQNNMLEFVEMSGPTHSAQFVFKPAMTDITLTKGLVQPGNQVDMYYLSEAYEMCKRMLNRYKKGEVWNIEK